MPACAMPARAMQLRSGMFDEIFELHMLNWLPAFAGRPLLRFEEARLASLMATLASTTPGDARAWLRRRTSRTARAEIDGRRHDARVIDASASGFRVWLGAPVGDRDGLILRVQGRRGVLRFPCRVVWSNAVRLEHGLSLDGIPLREGATRLPQSGAAGEPARPPLVVVR